MLTLLFQTFLMMLLTFLIGFGVASVIKIIANTADYYEFHRLHHDEFTRMKNLKKERIKYLYEVIEKKLPLDHEMLDNPFHGVSRGAVETDFTDDYLKGMSRGDDHYNIIDYYYPTKDKKNQTAQPK